jgi:hypothetical protein
VALICAFVAGVFAVRTKRVEGRINQELKRYEFRASIAKEVLLSDLSAQMAALLSIRMAATQAGVATRGWVLALFEAHREQQAQSAVFGLVDALILECAKAPAPHRATIESAAQALSGKSRGRNVAQVVAQPGGVLWGLLGFFRGNRFAENPGISAGPDGPPPP